MIFETCICIKADLDKIYTRVRDIRIMESFCKNRGIQFDFYTSTIDMWEAEILDKEVEYEDRRVVEIYIYVKSGVYEKLESEIKRMFDLVISKSDKSKYARYVPF